MIYIFKCLSFADFQIEAKRVFEWFIAETRNKLQSNFFLGGNGYNLSIYERNREILDFLWGSSLYLTN